MKISNLEKQLGDLQLRIDALCFAPGKIHGLLGGNGCGKSTLAKLLIGELLPDRGTIDPEGLSPQEITMTAQRPYLLRRSVYDNLIYPLQIRGRKGEEPRVEAFLKQGGLWEKRQQYARSLSSGEQQKLSFLRAMIFSPRFVILDETLSNLDPETLEAFENWILEVQKREAISWVVISHQLSVIDRLCDVVHFMEKGEIVESGECRQMICDAKDERVRAFMRSQMVRRESGFC